MTATVNPNAPRLLAGEVDRAITTLRHATTDAVNAIHAASAADQEAATAKVALERAEAFALRDGLVEGRNAEERKAHLLTLTANAREQHERAQKTSAQCRARLEVARLELEFAREDVKAVHLLAALAGAKGA